MAKVEDLKEVLKETLENRGVLSQVRARIRAEVFNALDEQSEVKPTLSNENFLINELIREYLEFNKYRYTKSVLTVETGQPKDPIDRKFLTQELNIDESIETNKLPLLYGMLSHFLQGENIPQKQPRAQKTWQPTSYSNKEAKDILLSDNSIQDEILHPTKELLVTYKN